MRTTLRVIIGSLIACFACSTSHAGSLHLTWSSGRQQFSTASEVCTLQVSPSVGSTLPATWRLIWSADDRTLRFLPESQADAGGVSWYSGMTSDAARIAHADTALHASTGGGAIALARYILEVKPGAAVHFMAVADADTIDSEQAVSEAYLNGGKSLSLPAVLRDCRLSRRGGALTFVAHGWDLTQVASARFEPSNGSRPLPLTVVRKTNGSLLASGYSRALMPQGRLILLGPYGDFAAAELAAEPDTTRLAYARDRVLFRVLGTRIQLPTRDRAASLDACWIEDPVLVDSLRACGISSLAAALPSFSAADIHTKNLRGDAVTLEDLTGLLVAHIDPALDPRDVALRIRKFPGILYAEPDYELHTI